MSLTAKDLKDRIQSIQQNSQDAAQLTSLLSDLQTECEAMIVENETMTKEKADISKECEDLRKANMKLFQKIGNPTEPSQHSNEGNSNNFPQGGQGSKEEDLTFDKLFDDKGGLL